MNQIEALKIDSFEPLTFVELDDVWTGQRKVVRVTENGTSYIDLDDEDATAFPLYEKLRPVEIGNILGWGLHLVDKFPEEQPAFRGLVDKLIGSGHGVLTINRAAHWAFKNHVYDFDRSLEAALAAAAAVRSGRQAMNRVIQTAEGEHA